MVCTALHDAVGGDDNFNFEIFVSIADRVLFIFLDRETSVS